MDDQRLTRRRFLAMLGVFAGAGALGGWAWWRDEGEGPTGAPATTGSSGPPTKPGGSPPPSREASPTTSASSGTTATTGTPTTTTATTTDPPPSSTTPSSTTTSAPPATTHAAAGTTAPPPTTTGTEPTVPTAGNGGREAICKEAWGAAPVRGELVDHRIERLTVHHTAVVAGSNTRAPARMRSYQEHHQGSGWPDIAYHYLIDANGHVYEGRPTSARGDTFTAYDPAGHFLVCCDGDFDRQSLPPAQLASLVDVLAWASVRFGAATSTIGGHRDYTATACPGRELARLIADGTLRSMVEARLAGGGATLTPLCGPAGLERVAAIEAGRL